MAAKLLVISCLVAVAHSLAVPVALHAHEEEHYAPAHYEFEYSVHDTHTGDIKQQQESRQGDAVHGSYSFIEADGRRRIVEYTADKEHGFNAVVRHEGQAQPAKIAYAAAPVAKLAYAAPVAKVAYAPAPVAYAAPVAKVAYAAPVAKLAYAAPVAKVAYAPAPVAYAAPVAKVAYAAPVAKLAYAAPVAKAAYAAPASHFTYSSPIISYHH